MAAKGDLYDVHWRLCGCAKTDLLAGDQVTLTPDVAEPLLAVGVVTPASGPAAKPPTDDLAA